MLLLRSLSCPADERPGAHDPPLIRVRRIQSIRLLRVGQRPLSHLHEVVIGHDVIVGLGATDRELARIRLERKDLKAHLTRSTTTLVPVMRSRTVRPPRDPTAPIRNSQQPFAEVGR